MDYIKAVEVLQEHIKFQNDRLMYPEHFSRGYRRRLWTAFKARTVKTYFISFWRDRSMDWDREFNMELDMKDIEYFLAKYEPLAKRQEANEKRDLIKLEEARLEATKKSLNKKRRELKALTGILKQE